MTSCSKSTTIANRLLCKMCLKCLKSGVFTTLPSVYDRIFLRKKLRAKKVIGVFLTAQVSS